MTDETHVLKTRTLFNVVIRSTNLIDYTANMQIERNEDRYILQYESSNLPQALMIIIWSRLNR